jgi:hypothetical protein
MLAKLEPKGIKGLAFWDNGFKSFSANTPIKVPADLKGKKLRIQSSKVLEEQIRSVGGLPQVMAFSEVYQALQTGVVDGTENPISNLYTQKMHEVQKHLTLTNHGYLGYAVIVNKKFWEGLPADVRGQLEAAMKEATAYANKIAQEENDKALEGVKKSGKTTVYVPTKEERTGIQEGDGTGARRRWLTASARICCSPSTRKPASIPTSCKHASAQPAGAPAAGGAFTQVESSILANPGEPFHEISRSSGGVVDHLPHGRRDADHFRRRRPPLCRECEHSRSSGLAAVPQLQLGAGTASSCSSGWPSSAPPTACVPASTSASMC